MSSFQPSRDPDGPGQLVQPGPLVQPGLGRKAGGIDVSAIPQEQLVQPVPPVQPAQQPAQPVQPPVQPQVPPVPPVRPVPGGALNGASKGDPNAVKMLQFLTIMGILSLIVVTILTLGIGFLVYSIVTGVNNFKYTHSVDIDGETINFKYRTDTERATVMLLADEIARAKVKVPIRTIVISQKHGYDSYDEDNLFLMVSLFGDVLLYAFINTSVMAALKLNDSTIQKIKPVAKKYIADLSQDMLKRFVATATAISVMRREYGDLSEFLVTDNEKDIYRDIDEIEKFLRESNLDIISMD